jgi:hypothetical protein
MKVQKLHMKSDGIFFYHHLSVNVLDGIIGKGFIGAESFSKYDLVQGRDLHRRGGIDQPPVLVPEQLFRIELLLLQLVTDDHVTPGLHQPEVFLSFPVIGHDGIFSIQCGIEDCYLKAPWKFHVGVASGILIHQHTVKLGLYPAGIAEDHFDVLGRHRGACELMDDGTYPAPVIPATGQQEKKETEATGKKQALR